MKIAQIDFESLQKEVNPDFEFTTLGGIVSGLIPYLFAGAGILLLLYLIAGGLGLMTSRGDPKAVQAAQGKITNALVGFVIVFLAFWIVQIIGNILGIKVFGEIFG